MLQLKNLTVSVADKKILDDINFNFKDNKVYAIMGPNGSGKSTLAYAISAHPFYVYDKKSKIFFNKKNITDLSPDKRSKLGIFLSFQSPLALNGVTVFQLLRIALTGKKDPLAIKKEIEVLAKKLHIKKELIGRSLNDGASGGEKKKLELLQAIVLEAKFLIFDEIDTGVDVDALKIMATFLNTVRSDKTILLITHYNRILKYIKPDEVLILNSGKIVKTGNYKLAENVEKTGYQNI